MGDHSQKKLQNILNMSLKLTDAEQKTYDDNQIDDERKEFLQSAIHQALEDDDSKRLVMYTKCFQTYNASDDFTEQQIEDLEVLFEALNFLNEGFDISKDFDKLGGLTHCLDILKSNQNNSMQWRAADLIANSIHNNPQCQQTILDNQGMEAILSHLKNSQEEMLQVKCLYSLSTLLGGYPVAEKKFCKLENDDFFVKMFEIKKAKVQVKTAFLLCKLMYSEETCTDVFITKKLMDKLVNILSEDIDPSHTHILQTLLQFLTRKRDILVSKEERLKLTKVFGNQRKELEKLDGEQYEEEIKAYDDLINLLK